MSIDLNFYDLVYFYLFNIVCKDNKTFQTTYNDMLIAPVNRETTRPGLAMIVLDFVLRDSVLASVNQEQGRVFCI